MNAVAADIYGPQTLLREGLVPPALVFRHPGFLRACHGVRPADGVFLHLVAFDLARGADGEWRVVGTRTQAPSGVGYALENRAIMSRLLPDAFHALRVHALSSFFHELRQVLFAGAPANGGAPHVVVLTPGPYNETYFEHAYLARQLGFPLVEGGDLTVRDERVFLKTVSGLRPVHAILRRLDDDFCDPLELRPDSTLGVPGLVQAWRAGHVLVANAFGMSVLESPALLAFLPPLCERLFGEPLEMPAIATWWCGETAALDDARRRLAEGIIKPAFADASMEPVFVSDLDANARREWAERLGTAPDAYVVEEFLPLSHAPVWHTERVESRALMLRVFLLADGRGDYRVMPGGLSRIAGEDRNVVSGQRGGGSKDTWVLSDLPVSTFAPVDRRVRTREAHGEPATSSRAAEHLFWLGRYAERSENGARLMRSVLGRLTDAGGVPAGLHPAFLRACARQRSTRAPLVRQHRVCDRARPHGGTHRSPEPPQSRIQHRADGARGQCGARSPVERQLACAQPAAPAVRAGIARARSRRRARVDRRGAVLARGGWRPRDGAHEPSTTAGGFSAWGVTSSGCISSPARSVTSRRIRQSAGPGLLEWLLELSDSLLAYRVRHMQHPEWASVVDLMLVDEHNPRSARFQLAKLAKHVRLLPDADLLDVLTEVERLLTACHSDVDAEQGELFGSGEEQLDALLSGCQEVSMRLGSALSLRYFSHVDDVPRMTVGR